MSHARTALPYALTVTVGFSLACFGVEGERAANDGACPEDEVCVDELPSAPGEPPRDSQFHGLMFHGQMLFDEGIDRLGPVAVGGHFDLSFTPIEDGEEVDVPLPDWAVTTDADVLSATPVGTRQVALTGVGQGRSFVRIVDPDDGALYDRVPIQSYEIDRVRLSNVSDRDRTTLYAGCTEMLGARLFAIEQVEPGTGDDGGDEVAVRIIDQALSVTALATDVQPDLTFWDCFTLEVPRERAKARFIVSAGGRDFDVEIPITKPGEHGCPELSE